MLHIVNRDNGKGKAYTLLLDYQPKMWRDGHNIKIKGDYGEVHTAIFNSAYQAALYPHFVDYTMNKRDDDPLAGEMDQCFRTDLWSPNAANSGWGFMYQYLIWKKDADYQELKDYVITRANQRWKLGQGVKMITDGSFSWSFIEYVIRAMEDVRHIIVKDDKIALTDTGIGDY